MLSYETALKLKEAGFPQGANESYLCQFNNETKEEDCAYNPTLSELIEACPKKHTIEDYFEGDFTLQYWTTKLKQVWHCGYDGGDGWYEGAEGEGSTPEEAVANLWLELNKK